MATDRQLERQALWAKLKPRYKWLVSAPWWVGLATMILSMYPNGVLLAARLGISTTEPVIQNPNGRLFMVCFCASFVLTLLISGFVTYRIISLWLVKVANYSREEVRLALTWRAYPHAWSITSPGPSSGTGQVE